MWNDASFFFEQSQQPPPFDRSPTNRFRLITDLGDPNMSAATKEPVDRATRDFSSESPVSDEIFDAYRSFYDYDDTP